MRASFGILASALLLALALPSCERPSATSPDAAACAADEDCPAGAVCEEGGCVAGCPARPCAADQGCVKSHCYPRDCPEQDCSDDSVCWSARCTTEPCVGVRCDPGDKCVRGSCYPEDCPDQDCDPDSACFDGACVQDRCIGVVCSPGTNCEAGACVPVPPACDDRTWNGSETDVDCGGPDACPRCGPGAACAGTSDCEPDLGCYTAICQPCRDEAGDPSDLLDDPLNCGRCGQSCPRPLHAPAACRTGNCGRGPCTPGHFDFDGDATFGCETTCADGVCTDPAGNQTPVTSDPVPEAGLVWSTVSSGAALFDAGQSSPAFGHVGLMGEPTPSLEGGATEATSAGYVNRPGFLSITAP